MEKSISDKILADLSAKNKSFSEIFANSDESSINKLNHMAVLELSLRLPFFISDDYLKCLGVVPLISVDIDSMISYLSDPASRFIVCRKNEELAKLVKTKDISNFLFRAEEEKQPSTILYPLIKKIRNECFFVKVFFEMEEQNVYICSTSEKSLELIMSGLIGINNLKYAFDSKNIFNLLINQFLSEISELEDGDAQFFMEKERLVPSVKSSDFVDILTENKYRTFYYNKGEGSKRSLITCVKQPDYNFILYASNNTSVYAKMKDIASAFKE